MTVTDQPKSTYALLGCWVGIIGLLVGYGYLQEKIMNNPYDGEKFASSAFLVFFNRIAGAAIGFGMLKYLKEDTKPGAPIPNFMFISVTNFIATYCQYEALKYVSFPTQTLGKCGKMVPVLILGSLVYKKQYTLKDYAIALIVTGGCMMFFLTGDISAENQNKSDSPLGLFLMGGYLLADGTTSTFQEKLFKGFNMSTYNQMLYVNSFSSLISFMIVLLRGQFFSSLDFFSNHPLIVIHVTILSICASSSQVLIYYTIKNFGALTYSTIMTVRQCISIILSAILFGHSLNFSQWVAAAVVFGILYYKSASKSHEKKKETQPKDDPIQMDPTNIKVVRSNEELPSYGESISEKN